MMKGLIIKDPWIELILEGLKTWEIRGSNSKIRGKIALIKSGTGMIYGTVEIVDSILLTSEQYHQAFEKHRITDTEGKALPYKKVHAWVLTNPVKFEKPIPYVHPQGAVIWVNLDNL
jgi:ASCH domain.